jgi:hypothetical protein
MTKTSKRGYVWDLELLTYRGIVASALHWQVKLTGGTEDVEVYYVMDLADAVALSSRDFSETPGRWSTRFRHKEDAQAAALVAFKHLANERDVLVKKFNDVGEVLAGPPDLVEQGEALTGDYMWWTWLDSFQRRLYDTHYGYNAPPSVRQNMTIVVKRSGSTWVVTEEKEVS